MTIDTRPSIRILPPEVAAKIAAGEVVERPASVAKELMENALDAGARRIGLAYAEGGRTLVRIADDGAGFAPGDLELACRSSATSKIESIEDLDRIRTMGFRGEALFAISSVSRMTITTRTLEETAARRLKVFGGRPEPVEPAAGSPGTTIEVRDLFYNVPARLKFLKTVATESGHLTQVFQRMAMARPDVHMELTADGSRTALLPAVDTRCARIADLVGHELADDLIEIDFADEYIRVEAYLAPPAHSRSSGSMQYTFLNGRYIRDKVIQHALSTAYRGLLPKGRHPVAFVFITIEPSEVDVNVHPAKLEVRFRRPSIVSKALIGKMGDLLLRSGRLVPGVSLGSEGAGDDDSADGAGASGGASSPGQANPDLDATTIFGRPDDDRPTEQAGLWADESPGQAPPRNEAPWPGAMPSTGPAPAATGQSTPRERIAQIEGQTGQQPDIAPAAPQPLGANPAGERRRVIQIHNAYIVEETSGGMAIVDQHALHERILFEELKARLSERGLPGQTLLAPEVVDAPADWVQQIEQFRDTFRRLGFEASAFGPTSIAIHACPTMLKQREVTRCFVELLEQIMESGDTSRATDIFDDLLHVLACRAAVMAGDPLTEAEMNDLLDRRDRMALHVTCPHGRPNTIALGMTELEKQFKRR